MTVAKVRMLIEFEADVGDDEDEKAFFLDEILKELVLHSNSFGDAISDDINVLGVTIFGSDTETVVSVGHEAPA